MTYERERVYARANRRIRLHFYLHRMPGDMMAFVTRNIGAGGLFAIHETAIPIGTDIVIDMYLEDETPTDIVGARVLRCDEIKPGIWGIAVEFTEITERTREAVLRFVEASLGEEPLPDIERYLLPNYVEELRKLGEEQQQDLLRPEDY